MNHRKTRHFQRRQAQRGITGEMLRLAYEYGARELDRIILDRKAVTQMIRELDGLKKGLVRIADKGGIVIVADGGALITAFPITRRISRRHTGYRESA